MLGWSSGGKRWRYTRARNVQVGILYYSYYILWGVPDTSGFMMSLGSLRGSRGGCCSGR
jgi:hypothetical protein